MVKLVNFQINYLFHKKEFSKKKKKKKMKILITGSTGYVGGYLLEKLANQHEVVGVGCSKGDQRMLLQDNKSIEDTMKTVQPNAVINCGAIASLEKCEQNDKLSYEVNCPEHLADCCAKQGAILIQLSTDIVYRNITDGVPAAVDLNPLNTYGKSKAAFEKYLSSHPTCTSVILRCSNIFGPPVNGITKFVQWVDSVLRDGTIPHLYSNEKRNFVYIGDIHKVISGILKSKSELNKPNCLIYNMGGPESLSREQFAHVIATHRGISKESVPSRERTEKDLKLPTPLDITFDSSRTFDDFRIIPTRLVDVVSDILPKL